MVVNRSVSIEQVGGRYILKSKDPKRSGFHGGKKLVGSFHQMVDFLRDHFDESSKTEEETADEGFQACMGQLIEMCDV